MRSGVAQYLPFGIMIGLVIFVELMLAFVPWDFKEQTVNNITSPINTTDTNTVALGKVVYYYFLLSVRRNYFINCDDRIYSTHTEIPT